MKNKFKLYLGTILCKFVNKILVCTLKYSCSGQDLLHIGFKYHFTCYKAVVSAGPNYKYIKVFYQGIIIAGRCIVKGDRILGKFEQAQMIENQLEKMIEQGLFA